MKYKIFDDMLYRPSGYMRLYILIEVSKIWMVHLDLGVVDSPPLLIIENNYYNGYESIGSC